VASAEARTYQGDPGGLFAGGAVVTALLFAFAALVAVVGVSWAGHVAVGLVLLLVAAATGWWGLRWSRACVRVGPDGVEIAGPLRVRRFGWEEIRGFEPGWWGRGQAVVFLRRTGGGRTLVSPLRWNGARTRQGTERRRREAERMCAALEAHRPATRAPA
jgi:hypothetical protein